MTDQAAETRTAGKLTAILFVDIVESSRVMHQNELATQVQLPDHIDHLCDVVTNAGGLVRGLRGDGLLATFESAVNAVEGAIKIQAARVLLSGAPVTLDFRVGIHLGDVVERGGEIYGTSVNMAARVEPLAPTGGICITRAVYDVVNHRVRASFESIGTPDLRNITDRIEVFRVIPDPGASRRTMAVPSESTQGVTGSPSTAQTVHGSPAAAQNPPESPARTPTVSASAGAEPASQSSNDTIPSVAVLPFRSLSTREEDHYLANGIANDVITRLTRFRNLDVIARASTFSMNETDGNIREIGERLGVQYLAHGHLQVAGNRLRLAVDLVDPTSERIVASKSFDADFENVFEIQDQIAESAVSAMMVEIERAERGRAVARNPDSLNAYSLCLRGTEEVLQVSPESCRRAMILFDRAVEASPSYARAYAALSRAHSFQWKYRWVADREQALERAAATARHAVDLDFNDARAHAELGWVSLYKREHDVALASYQHALDLNPGDADIIAEYADVLKHDGQPAAAVPHFEHAIRLNPHAADHYRKDLAHTHLVNRDFEAAIQTVKQMRRPEIARRALVASYALLGRDDEACREANKLRADHPDFSAEAWVTMVPDRLPEHTELFLEGMKRAGL